MYSLPSASQIRAPWPLLATTGVPPTPPNARTGEFTPPGKSAAERRIISADLSPITANGNRSHRQLSPRFRLNGTRIRRNQTHYRCVEIVVIDDVLHSNLEQCSGGLDLVEVCHAIHVVRLPRKASHRNAVAHAIDNELRTRSDSQLVPLGRYRALKLRKPLEPLTLERIRNIVFHFSGCGSLLRGIRESSNAIEGGFLEKFHQLLEITFRLAREADNAGCSYRNSWNGFAKASYSIANCALSLRTPHACEHRV